MVNGVVGQCGTSFPAVSKSRNSESSGYWNSAESMSKAYVSPAFTVMLYVSTSDGPSIRPRTTAQSFRGSVSAAIWAIQGVRSCAVAAVSLGPVSLPMRPAWVMKSR